MRKGLWGAAGVLALLIAALAAWFAAADDPADITMAASDCGRSANVPSIAGRWQLRMKTPAGDKTPVLTLVADGRGGYAGTLVQPGRDVAVVSQVRCAGEQVRFNAAGRLLIPVNFRFRVRLSADALSGSVRLGFLPASDVTGTRLPSANGD